MTLVDQATVASEFVAANERYAAQFAKGDLPMPPGRKVAVVVCMDARIDPAGALGLEEGDAHVIRNAGGRADDAIRSLAISQELLGTREIVVIHHTDCGMLTFTNNDIRQKLGVTNGPESALAAEQIDFLPFPDVEQSVRDDVVAIKASPLLRKAVPVSGFVYELGRPHSPGGLTPGRYQAFMNGCRYTLRHPFTAVAERCRTPRGRGYTPATYRIRPFVATRERSLRNRVAREMPHMTVVPELLAANERYAAQFTYGDLPVPPACKLVVLTCRGDDGDDEDHDRGQTGDVHPALTAQQRAGSAMHHSALMADDAVQHDLEWPGRGKAHRDLDQEHREMPATSHR